ncbi:mitochondrial carrier domain-containing protein [Phakopsora pachyrhizi]|uniref:Mitochondrial carrier domain-containing protein n=1 Tax=Phakopsora pachyrhizi TaxID=170000 RepID=A0AAV0B0G8_PHAPC|nr:mitochondrial carrier domain-containing protein [Phakopsora pachyrhizi]
MSDNSNRRMSAAEGFVSGALGACIAVTFTNPMEVAKTRLQLDGELRSKNSPKVYKNTFDVLRKIAMLEGLKSCQKGLGAAYAYQFTLNGSRIGFYEPMRQALGSISGQDPSKRQVWSSISAGAISGVIGAILGNPLFLVKARLQASFSSRTFPSSSSSSSPSSFSSIPPLNSQSSAASLSKPFLTQSSSSIHRSSINPINVYNYKSALDGLRQILRTEGIKGLARGMDAAILRTAMGSSVQLPAYNYAKSKLAPYFSKDSIAIYFASSSFSGLCVLAAMQPADTTLTRMYNQSSKPGKRLYKNPIDCLWKTIKIEGLSGLYKGSTAHFFRIAPHTIITLVANEAISQWC